MKKILITATVQSHIAQFHLPLIKLLKEKGYEVHVAARNNLNEKNGLEICFADKIFDIAFERSPISLANIRAYKMLKKILEQNQYDIIHCNTPMGGIITRLAAKKYRKNGTEVYYTAHGFHFYHGAPLKSWLLYYPIEKVMSLITDKLLTITKEDYNLAKKRFKKTDVFYIHGVGVNNYKYFPYNKEQRIKLRRELDYQKNNLLLLCIGELNENKNQEVVIRSLTNVVKEIPTVKLLLAGNGVLEKKLRDLVTELGLLENVEFLGYRTDLDKYLNICDIVISASLREGLPLNIMEAMLCARPIIASQNRGHRELLCKDNLGRLVEPKDIAAYSKAILDYNDILNQNEDYGVSGLDFVKEYTIDSVIEELKGIYEL